MNPIKNLDTKDFKDIQLNFEKEYKHQEKGWKGRKCMALPRALWTGIIQPIYHFGCTLLSIPVAIVDKGEFFKKHVFNVQKDMEESYGWLSSFFNDKYGQFYVYKAQTERANGPNSSVPVSKDPKIVVKTELSQEEVEKLVDTLSPENIKTGPTPASKNQKKIIPSIISPLELDLETGVAKKSPQQFQEVKKAVVSEKEEKEEYGTPTWPENLLLNLKKLSMEELDLQIDIAKKSLEQLQKILVTQDNKSTPEKTQQSKLLKHIAACKKQKKTIQFKLQEEQNVRELELQIAVAKESLKQLEIKKTEVTVLSETEEDEEYRAPTQSENLLLHLENLSMEELKFLLEKMNEALEGLIDLEVDLEVPIPAEKLMEHKLDLQECAKILKKRIMQIKKGEIQPKNKPIEMIAKKTSREKKVKFGEETKMNDGKFIRGMWRN